jgi:hypothetical protein
MGPAQTPETELRRASAAGQWLEPLFFFFSGARGELLTASYALGQKLTSIICVKVQALAGGNVFSVRRVCRAATRRAIS